MTLLRGRTRWTHLRSNAQGDPREAGHATFVPDIRQLSELGTHEEKVANKIIDVIPGGSTVRRRALQWDCLTVA